MNTLKCTTLNYMYILHNTYKKFKNILTKGLRGYLLFNTKITNNNKKTNNIKSRSIRTNTNIILKKILNKLANINMYFFNEKIFKKEFLIQSYIYYRNYKIINISKIIKW